MRIGFIGLGVMGAPTARNLIAAGHDLATVLDRSPLPEGIAARILRSPADVARASEMVIAMVPDTPDVQRLLLGKGGVAEAIAPGALTNHELTEERI